jgi:hypothetical protein
LHKSSLTNHQEESQDEQIPQDRNRVQRRKHPPSGPDRRLPGPPVEFETGESWALHGFEGDRRRETAELVIRRRHLGRLGFHRRPDGTFEVIISDFDSRHTAAAIVREVKQRYARLQVEKPARARGYRVEEIPAEDKARRGPLEVFFMTCLLAHYVT